MKNFTLPHFGDKMHNIVEIKTIALNGPRITSLVEFDGVKAVKREFPVLTENMKNEIAVLQALDRANLKMQPKLLSVEDKNIIVSFLDGISAGDSFFFEEKFIKSVSPLDVVNKILTLQKVSVPGIKSNFKIVKDFYEKKIININRWKPTYVDGSLVEKWINEFRKLNYKEISDNPVLSHNDLNPGNIVYKSGEIVGYIDWELSRLESFARDFASVYYAAIKYPEWKYSFEKSLFRSTNRNEARVFWLQVLFSVIGDMSTFNEMKVTGRKEHFKSGELSNEKLDLLLKFNYHEFIKLSKKILLDAE